MNLQDFYKLWIIKNNKLIYQRLKLETIKSILENYFSKSKSKNLTLSEQAFLYLNNLLNKILCECWKEREFISFFEGYNLTCTSRKCRVEN